MAKKVQLQTNGKEWQVIDGEQVLVDAEKQDINPITSSSCVQIEGFRTLEEAVSDNKMLSQDLTYTKVMDKVGGDYHQNVLDGQYSKAILYGNTQVNLCEEDSSNALQIPTTFTSFNNGELQIKNKESQVVAPLIKGVTMVNLAQKTSVMIPEGNNGGAIKNVKPNTKYTLFLDFTVQNTQKGFSIHSFKDNTYLQTSLIKIGMGEKVKLTFTTHEEANTIYIVNNNGYGGEIQLDNIMLIEGDQTALDIPFFKGMRSVELVRPLTNLFTDTTPSIIGGVTVTNSNGTVVATSVAIDRYRSVQYKPEFKANTDYVVIWDTLTYTHTVTSDDTVCVCKNDTIIANPVSSSFIFKNRSIKFNTGSEPSTITLRIHATLGNTETGKTTVTGLRVFEYDDYLRSVDLQSIGWFSGTKNVAVEPIKTCGKNLYPYGDINFTPTSTGWFDAKGNSQMTGDIASKSHSRFLLKKGTYYFSIGSNTNAFCQLTDDKENMGVNANSSFTLQEDKYITLRVKVTTANTSATVTNIQIERGETVTDYVAHDSRYYEPDGQNAIVLRSLPSGVCDSFNLQTGEYTRKIGEIIIDGSEDWTLSTKFSSTYNSYYFELNEAFRNNIKYANDKYQLLSDEEDLGKKIGIYMGSSLGKIAPFISSDKMTLSEFKEYLQQNPVTVQYELATPITTIIPRTIKRNNNGTVSTIDFGTYTNKESLVIPSNPSYLTINSMTSIKPVVEPITYIDFKTRLKANTDYSIVMDKNSTDKTINLGGTSKTYADKMLVRTPSIDLEQNLRISGSGSIQNIMVIEGDVLDKELPYFNGMCNVKMPIVKNVGKNLFNPNIIGDSGQYIRNDTGSLVNDITSKYTVGYICVEPNTKYYLYVKGLQRVYFLDNNKKWISRTNSLYQGGTQTHTINTNFTTSSNCHYIQIQYRVDELDLTNATLVEYGDNNPHVDYKENSVYAAQGEIRLTPDMFEVGAVLYSNQQSGTKYETMKSNDYNHRARLKDLISIKPDTVYNININNDKYRILLHYFDASGGSIQKETDWIGESCSIKTPTDAHKVNILLSYKNGSQITLSTFDFNAYQLLELDSTVQLRSLPNGVKDELNLLTGEYIQRVGEVVLDGSDDEDWQLYKDSIGGSKYFRIAIPTMKSHGDVYTLCTHAICDKLENVVYYSGIYNMSSRPDSVVAFALSNTLNTQAMFVYQAGNQGDLVQFKQWLQSNPITVQYELAQPIISYPRIVSNTQEREVGVKLPNGICDTYNPSTGITVKRVGFIEFDGSEDWYEPFVVADRGAVDMYGIWTEQPLCDAKPAPTTGRIPGVCDSLNFKNSFLDTTNEEFYFISPTGRFNMNLSRSKLSEPTEQALKTYLSQNPIKLWYELKNPIVTTDIVLPNGVHDEYNPLTGLYTKRVGYIELDGSEEWKLGTTKTNTQVFELIMLNEKLDVRLKNNIICDKMPIANDSGSDIEKIAYHGSYGNNQTTMSFYIALLKTKASTPNELKTYLSQNPIKVWYELSTPITYQLTPYFGLPMPYAYKDGYLIMDSAYNGQTLPPEITYQLTINRTGQITQNNIKLKEHTARLSNLEYMLIEATLDSIFDREMQNFELELMNIELINLDE